ncbi:MAG: hypothetical protein WC422_00410 [Candidatus Paceibacterota bacterium]|jgi:hypothetical protein
MAQAQEQKQVSLENGPGKFEIMLSLFDKKEIAFTLCGGHVLGVRITSVQEEDGSGESWNLEGRLTGQFASQSFRAYYSTKRNKGSITLF